ncbi:cysteine protease ATG4C-like [Oppia nitens]|uniref:cysteine protease ATG4C-like n=1 Tax=Oppia nitens TaxID=1686743 RepID=UPI0023DA6C18|nr:cysteine protease ATG4C-like [Oppia nitens]
MNSRKISNNEFKQRLSLSSLTNRSTDSLPSRVLPQYYGHPIGDHHNSQHSVANHMDEDDDDIGGQSPDKMKTMFKSIWNNVKFGFTTRLKTRFSYESPICLLGQFYHKKLTDSHSTRDDNQSKSSAIDLFRHDFYSRIWFTYRRQFPKLDNSSLTTDTGWGCMLRSAQMLLAQALLIHYLGRHWRWKGSQSDKEDMIHRMIIKWFADDPNASCSPFSVHQLVRFGEQMGKKPGDWYGPASVAHLLKNTLSTAAESNPILNNICCYVAQDCTVYIEDVITLCTSNSTLNRETLHLDKKRFSKPNDEIKRKFSLSSQNSSDIEIGLIAHEDMSYDSLLESSSKSRTPSLLSCGKMNSTFNLTDTSYSSSGPRSLPFIVNKSANNSLKTDSSQNKWRGVVIIVPVRLGSDRLNPIYISCVKQILSHSSCLGIIGGKPKHSLYFMGFQDEKLIYLDPHYCQSTVDVRQINFPLDSFHCDNPLKTPITCMDPSCALAFYCRTQPEFFDFVKTMKEYLIPPNQSADYPMFVFNDGSNTSDTNYLSKDDIKPDRLLKVRHRFLNSEGRVEREFHTEEFVML